jgi:arylsulfatase A-like enzyme
MRPNILLITVDQMRADCMGVMNHPVIETPYLDLLAHQGVLFPNAFSATPTCIPARAALFTGMSQRNHGRVGYQEGIPWNYEHTLPGELAKAGYHTQCVGKMHVHPPRSLLGFHNVIVHDGYMHVTRQKHKNRYAESFDQYDDYLVWLRERAGAHHDLIDNGTDCNASTYTRPWHLPEEYHPTNWAVTQSIDFLRRRDPRKPFFLWLSFVRPHAPLDPPQVYYDMYVNEDLPEPVIGDWADQEDAKGNGRIPTTNKGIIRPRSLVKRARAAYYALITHIDHQIGRLLNALYEYGVNKNTVILFTSDHGDMMGDHHMFKKTVPYQGSVNVPFILSDPGNILNLRRGTVNRETVELRDVMPTLLEAAGADIPPTVDGKSVIPLAQGKPTAWREYIHGEHFAGEGSHHYITNGKEKYIWFSQTGREQYFDLQADPYETVCLASRPEYGERIAYWREKLIGELTGREEGFTDGTQLFVGRKITPVLSHILEKN